MKRKRSLRHKKSTVVEDVIRHEQIVRGGGQNVNQFLTKNLDCCRSGYTQGDQDEIRMRSRNARTQ